MDSVGSTGNRDGLTRPPRLRLAVLDMVGTTITDDGRTEQAMARALLEHGVEPGSTRFESMLGYARDTMGYSKLTVFTHLFDDPRMAESANKVFELAYDELIADGGIRAIPGAADTIAWLRDAGMKVCLATGFGRHTQNMVLESLGWMGEADLSLCPDDAGRGRPYPDMILTAVLALDLDDELKKEQTLFNELQAEVARQQILARKQKLAAQRGCSVGAVQTV